MIIRGEWAMKAQFIMLGFVGLIAMTLVLIEINNKRLIKKNVKLNWGTFPRSARIDTEESLKNAWRIKKKYQKYDSEIDDVTWSDLDMLSVFQQVNLTYSSAGSEALYQRLRSVNFADTESLEKTIDYYNFNPKIRERIQFYFAYLGKKDKNFVEDYLNEASDKNLNNVSIFVLLGMLPIVFLITLLFFPHTLIIFLLVLSVVFNFLYYQVKKEKLNRELTCMGYLVQTISCAKKLAKLPIPDQQELLKNLKPIKSILIFGVSFRFKTNSESELFFDYISAMLMLPFISYNFVVKKITVHNQEFKEVWRLLGKLEIAAAVLNYRTIMPDTTQPVFSKKCKVYGKAVYHPLLAEPVSNDVDWEKNTLVTGSNASGKSTYVKSVAISCILSLSINTALAERFQLPWAHVMTSMSIEDNLFEGDSYFVAELKSVKRIIENIKNKKKCLCFIDEILKGTNTIERIATSASIIEWLNHTDSLSFIATHDSELTKIVGNTCSNIHFEEMISKGNELVFSYKLQNGPAKTRNAIQLLRVYGYPEEIIQEAEKEAAIFDREGNWQVLP